jgi:predicted outer membrane repeat protein
MADRLLSLGSSGPDVADVQQQLNSSPPTNLPLLNVDGVFGQRTLARVREFQGNNGLKADGIVGPLTRAAFQRRSVDVPPRSGIECGNSGAANLNLTAQRGRAFQSALISLPSRSRASSLGGGSSAAAIPGLPTLKRLTPAQEATARSVFGASIDFTNVFISDKTGIGGLPFTVAVPGSIITGSTKQIMNLGTFVPTRDLLIHELSHVWQSQHHSDATAFMKNSVTGQGAAIAANELAARSDPTVKANSDFPVHFPFSTYAYIPGSPFGSYGAEQIANSVEHGEGPIVAHVAGVATGVVDSDNTTSLTTSRIGDRRVRGTIF